MNNQNAPQGGGGAGGGGGAHGPDVHRVDRSHGLYR